MDIDRLNWASRWYAIGDAHREFNAEQPADEDFLKLTMAAIAKELNRRGLTEASVYLAVDLPLTWVALLKGSFVRYRAQVQILEFRLNDKSYVVEILSVEVYTWGFPAAADRMKEFIGNSTMNIMLVNNYQPICGKRFMEKYTTYQCILNHVKRSCVRWA